MRVRSAFFIALLLTATATAAQPPRLLYSLPDDARPAELRLEIRVDNRLFVDDVLALRRDAAGGTFELLQQDPVRAARLAELARTDRTATVRFSLDGRPLDVFTLAEYLGYSEQLALSNPKIALPRSESATFGIEAGAPGERETAPVRRAVTASACTDTCAADRLACYQQGCGMQAVCDECELSYNACVQNCYDYGDDDGDGLANNIDNCRGAFNPNQADCDGDGIGDVCDSFNGTRVDISVEEDLASPPDFLPPVYIYEFCSGPWHYTVYEIWIRRTTHYQNRYCDGTVVDVYLYQYYHGFAWDAVYDPWTCRSSLDDPIIIWSTQTSSFSSEPKLELRDGDAFLTVRGVEHQLPQRESAWPLLPELKRLTREPAVGPAVEDTQQ